MTIRNEAGDSKPGAPGDRYCPLCVAGVPFQSNLPAAHFEGTFQGWCRKRVSEMEYEQLYKGEVRPADASAGTGIAEIVEQHLRDDGESVVANDTIRFLVADLEAHLASRVAAAVEAAMWGSVACEKVPEHNRLIAAAARSEALEHAAHDCELKAAHWQHLVDTHYVAPGMEHPALIRKDECIDRARSIRTLDPIPDPNYRKRVETEARIEQTRRMHNFGIDPVKEIADLQRTIEGLERADGK